MTLKIKQYFLRMKNDNLSAHHEKAQQLRCAFFVPRTKERTPRSPEDEVRRFAEAPEGK